VLLFSPVEVNAPHTKTENKMQNKSKLLDRARKLFAMSQTDSSPHEAEIAMRRLSKLMEELDITEADLIKNPDSTEYSSFNGEIYKRFPKWYVVLAYAAAKLTDTRVVTITKKLGRNRIERFMQFQGVNDGSQIAILTLDYLIESVDRGLNNYLKQESTIQSIALGWESTRTASTDYRTSFAFAVSKRAEKLAEERSKSMAGTGLIVVKNQLIAEHFGHVKGKRTKVKVRTTESSEAGKRDGNKVGLNTQIKSSETKGKLK